LTVYLVRERKCFWITLIPALFMTTVCSTWFFVSKQALNIGNMGYGFGIICLGFAVIWFSLWYNKEMKHQRKN